MLRQQRPTSRHDEVARILLSATLYAIPALMCLHASAAIADPDIWWHLRTGEWIMQRHAVPHTDPFSLYGKPWQAYSWLFELLVLKLYQVLGLSGIIVYTTAMVLAITVALHRLIQRFQTDFTKASLLTLATMISLSRLYTPRPWLFTILFFILEIDLLVAARRSGDRKKLLWLPLLFALWANFHIQFVDGLVALSIAAIEATWERWRSPKLGHRSVWKFWMLFVLCCLAAGVNPYGLGIYKVAYRLASQPGVLSKVAELQAMPFRGPADFTLLFLAMAAAGALAWNRRFRLFELTLLAMGAALSFRSQRDVWFVAVISSAILASGPIEMEDQERRWSALPSSFAAAIAASVVCLGALLLHLNNSNLHAELAETMPVHAVEFVKEEGFRGPLYNTYSWGGFMIWNLRMPVSIDGRAALQGDNRIDRSIATWNGTEKWASDPDLLSSGLVIAPRQAPLTQLLLLDTRFQPVFKDKVAVVFVTRDVHEKVTLPIATLASGDGMSACGLSSKTENICAF